MYKKQRVLLVITLIWTVIIFSFSLQPADISSDMSSGFGRWILETFLSGILERLDTIPVEQLEAWHTVLRKCAHFAEYFVLGMLWVLTLPMTGSRREKITAIGLSVLTASVDETIQRFVPGRSGQLSDVFLDSLGALTGMILILVIRKFRHRNSDHQEKGRLQDDF